MQERCFEIELTNEVDGINDDDLLVVKQMDMDMKNETLPRIFIVSQECYWNIIQGRILTAQSQNITKAS